MSRLTAKESTASESEVPGFMSIIRAPFLTSILSPVCFGTLLSLFLFGRFYAAEFVLITVMGLAVHISTNVYNDIYDTLQGNDTINRHRNAFSGGSGYLIEYPRLETPMFTIARVSLRLAIDHPIRKPVIAYSLETPLRTTTVESSRSLLTKS